MARPKKEGMDYFPHDTDAANDEKVDILRSLYGNDGYVFYFIMLERIYRTKKFELKIAEVSEAETGQKLIRNDPEMILILSKKLLISVEKFEKILSTCFKQKIFSQEKYEEFGVITSDGIKKRSKPVSEKRRNMAKAHKNKKIVSDAETPPETPQKLPRNDPETPQSKGEDSIGEHSTGENKDIPPTPPPVQSDLEKESFEKFWNLYDKKKDKDKCFTKWKKISKKDRVSIFEALPAYLSSTPDKQYRKNPLTYLNGKGWNDEIITSGNQKPGGMKKNGFDKNYYGESSTDGKPNPHF